MKQTGIIMSGDHPQKCIDGTKTQTRRVIKPQPNIEDYGLLSHPVVSRLGEVYRSFRDGRQWVCDDKGNPLKCPYGQVGDLLIIKETWATEKIWDDTPPRNIPTFALISYKDSVEWGNYIVPIIGKTRSSMFMCKWMSRARPEITEVRVERLRSISPADAMAEGGYSIDGFIEVYIRINHLPEDADPWNWALSFKLIKSNEGA